MHHFPFAPVLNSMRRAVVRRCKKMVPAGVRLALRELWKEIKIARIVRKAAPKFKALWGKRGLRIQLGCGADLRSEEHTSELQSRFDLVCRLLLEKKK